MMLDSLLTGKVLTFVCSFVRSLFFCLLVCFCCFFLYLFINFLFLCFVADSVVAVFCCCFYLIFIFHVHFHFHLCYLFIYFYLTRQCPSTVECSPLTFFPNTPVFCLSRPCRNYKSCNIISPSSFLPFYPSFPNLGCHSVNILPICCYFYELHVQAISTLTDLS